VGATVHRTPNPADRLPDAVVVVRDGLILRVGSLEEVPPSAWPAGARSWDVTGQHVYAGFIDPFVEAEVPRPSSGPGGTGAGTVQRHWNINVVAERHALDAGGLDISTADTLRRMGFGAAGLVPMDPGKRRGGNFRGTSAVVSLLPVPTSSDTTLPQPRVYVPSWALNASFETSGGFGFGTREDREGQGWFGTYPTSRMGAIALIRQTFLDAQGWTSATDKPAPAWAAAVLAPRPVVFDTDSEVDALRAAGIAAEFSRAAIMVGSGTEYRRLEAVAAKVRTLAAGFPELKDADPWILPLVDPRTPDVSSVAKAEEADLRTLMMWEQASTNPARLEAAGVRASLTTARLRDRGEFLSLVRKAVEHGLPAESALAMLTTRPAALTGTGDRLGTVEPGKIANLVVADRELFDWKKPAEAKSDEAKEDAKPDADTKEPDAAKTLARSGNPRVLSVWVEGRRFEYATLPMDVAGMWRVEIPGAPASERFIRFEGELGGGKTPKATIIKDGKRSPGQVKTEAANPDTITILFDHEPLDGKKGMYTITGMFLRDAGKPAAFVGKGLRTDGGAFDFTAARLGPPLAVGTWRVTEADGALKDANSPDQLTLAITETSVTLTFTKPDAEPIVIKADDVVAAGNLLRFRHGLKKLGLGDGESIDTVTVEGDTFVGESTLPDGSKHGYKAVRATPPPADKSEKEKTDKSEGEKSKPIFDERLAGRWLLHEVDGKPNPERAVVYVKSDGAVILNARGRIVTPTKAAIDRLKLSYTIDLEAFGGSGQADVVATFDPAQPDALTGTMTIPSTREFPWRALRLPGNPDVLADIPEILPTPFQAFGTLPPEPGATPAPDTILRGATVWTMGPKGTIKDAAVVIADGTILFVGTDADLDAWMRAGVKIRQPWRDVDAKGLHLTPGIIDAHSHTGLANANEVGRAVTSMVRIDDVLSADDVNWYRQLAGGVTAVNSLHGSANSIGGQNAITKLRWGVSDPLGMKMAEAPPGIKFALGENPKRGNSGDGGTFRYPQTRMGVEAQIRDRFHAAKEYAAARAKDPTQPRDLELDALAEVLAGTRLVHAHSYRQDEILMLGHVARDFNFTIGTYQHILEGYKVAEVLKAHSGGASGFSDWWAFKVEVQDAIPFAFPLMHKVGVLCSFNSDDTEMARRLNTEAAKAVKYGGLSDEEALAFVTLNPAKQMKIDRFVGSIEVGKQADLVVWSGHPLSSRSRVHRTFVDGVERFSLERDAALRTRNAADRERILQKLLKDKADRPSGGSGTRGGGGGGRRRPTTEAQTDAGGGKGVCGTDTESHLAEEASR
jgi:imidazolonepropionase-like amidohydrolase